jgi:membrane protein
MGAAFSLFYRLRQSPAVGPLVEESVILHFLPFAASCLGLTMLYWLVPQSRVRFSSAALGGVTAAILLESVRQGFGLYLVTFRQATWVVYGSFALILFFMLSIQLGWLIILACCEMTYVSHHWRLLSPHARSFSQASAPWLGLGALVFLGRRLLSEEPITSRENLTEVLRLTPEDFDQVLAPILRAGLVQEANGGSLVLATVPQQLPVERVLAAYDAPEDELYSGLPEPYDKTLESLIHRIRRYRGEGLSGLTVASFLDEDLVLPCALDRGP